MKAPLAALGVILGPSLLRLDINNCPDLTGDLSLLSSCPNLLAVALGRTALEGNILVLETLPQLEVLSLQWNQGIGGDLRVFKQLRQVRDISLYGCKTVKGNVSSFRSCRKLQRLSLAETDAFGDISSFQRLYGLSELALDDCRKLHGNISSLRKLTALQVLKLNNCAALVGEVEELADLTCLTELSLFNCKRLKGNLQVFLDLPVLNKLILWNTTLKGNKALLRQTMRPPARHVFM